MMRSQIRPASGLAAGRQWPGAAHGGLRPAGRCCWRVGGGGGTLQRLAAAARPHALRPRAAGALPSASIAGAGASVDAAAQRSGGQCSTSGRGAASSAAAAAAAPLPPRAAPPPPRRARAAAAAALSSGGAAAGAAKSLQPPPPPPLYFFDTGRKDPEGNPILKQLDPEEWTEFEPAISTDALLDGLDGVDYGSEADARASASDAEVPATRLIEDSEELDLVGDGLPIIHGEEWPEVYWAALRRVSASGGAPVDVPAPHPKFSLRDLRRIAAEGPRFGDVVLEHAERVHCPDPNNPTGDRPVAEAYTYVPFTVLGDYMPETEPDWLRLPRRSPEELWAGLSARNWTAKGYE
ncbi:hypothetical protein Rsub_09118 [Raphidocelis subcapitata]|uniref:Uncharacterized protein n=1 Tax=Raphidocelis subcapitata TaxID=307507 RepID=A0A2V0PHL1_9CHLO|nr:hypothetical protein Rsub_09118 [Raphidocelis subcapitata]|eukprot:GBF96535.1 hypothetical protein Rsub_09118 [Raphidocelis subcapitata]